ncbi:MAG: carbohydrate kinase family protein [Clostridia bacterium]|nr:carbohydrate kinase family protein [Clostridia bacterium]
MKVLCIGGIMCDVAFSPVEKIDGLRGGSVVSETFSIHGGGEGNNASMDFATLGEEVRLVGRVGADFIGDHLLSELNKKGVDTSSVIRVKEEPTTISVQMISGVGARTLAAKRWGANETLAKDDVPDELIEWADHVHVVAAMCLHGFDGEGSASVFEKAHKLGKTTSMDLNNPRFDGPCFHLYEDALYNCDVFLPSSYELERSVGLTDMSEIREFFSKYGISILGVKRSELGAYLTDFKEEIYMPSLLEGDPVDVVGAGDAFSSTFVSAYKRGYCMQDCGAIASAASAHVLSTLGCTAGMRDFETLKAYAAARGALKI